MTFDLKLVAEKIPTPIFVAKPMKDDVGVIYDFEILYKNEQFTLATGDVITSSKKWSEFKDNIDTKLPIFNMMLDAIAGRFHDDATYYSSHTQSWFKVEMSYIPEEEYVVITLKNITSEKKYYQKLKQSLITDPLTGFMNRSGFSDTLASTLEITRNTKTFAAFLIIDIDNLKNVNDSLGSKEGDSLILKVADILRQFKRDNIQVFRYGDDEYAVILHNFKSEDSMANVIDCIFEAFQIKQIGVSGGISFFPSHSEETEEIIRFADMAVHYAKKNGKNNFVYFEPDMQRIFIQHLTLQTKMTTAVLESLFKQYYQPQFDITTGELRGFEALIRWHDNELGDIAPSVFIPLAEETGLIIPIGRWVLKTAISTLKSWQVKYQFNGIMSINVSPVQLLQDTFIGELKSLIRDFDIDTESLEIEITEGVMINNMSEAIERLHELKQLGIKISLDDFGTGYSSLSYLQMLPLTTLKIDKAFINNITSSDGIQANITSSIITMVTNMGLETIAEGVENPDQLKLLEDFNCNIVQGFLRGKPMPVNSCEAYLGGDKSALIKN